MLNDEKNKLGYPQLLRYTTIFWIAFFIQFWAVSSLAARERKKTEPLVLENANEYLRVDSNNAVIHHLNGDVQFKHGDAHLLSDRADWFETAKFIIFTGHVVFTYPDQQIQADSVFYAIADKHAVAAGGLKLTDFKEDAVITGGRGNYDRNSGHLIVTDAPVLVLKTKDTSQSVTVVSRQLEYFSEEKQGLATDSVVITKKKMKALCGRAEFLSKDNHLILTRNPRASDNRSRLIGDRMDLWIKDEKLEHIDVTGNARGYYCERVDTAETTCTESSLSARTVSFFFENEQLTRVLALHNAYSFYTPASTDTVGVGYNTASGDTIVMYLSDEEVDRVTVSGGVQGTYITRPQKKTAVSEDTVKYYADYIEYRIKQNEIALVQQARIDYSTLILTADSIHYHTESEILTAGPRVATKPEQQRFRLKDGTDEIYFSKLSYNIRTRKGRLKQSSSQFEDGYYHGQHLARVDENVILVNSGQYTTCDRSQPHFYFSSPNMKIVAKDKVVARPVIFFVEKIPLFGVPYYLFPIKRGRHSGFLTFRIGEFFTGGRGVRDLGYYWAPSDYWDLVSSVDLTENNGNYFFLLKNRFSYAWRYHLNGMINASYSRNIGSTGFSRTGGNRWDLTINHLQDISPSVKLSAIGSFVSDRTYYQDISNNLNQRLNRVLNPRANLTKTFASGISLFLSAEVIRNLDNEARQYTMPTLSLQKSARPLILPPKKVGEELPRTRWFHSIYYSYRGSTTNFSSWSASPGSQFKHYWVAAHEIGLSAPQNLVRYIALTPSISLREHWFYIFPSPVAQSQNIATGTFYRRGTYSLSIGAQTNLYGTFGLKAGNLIGLRHVVTPQISFQYAPRFSRHALAAAFVGQPVSTSRTEVMGMSVNNIFQVKTRHKDQERKIDLVYLNLSTGLNFLASTRRLSNLSTSIRTSAIPAFGFEFTGLYDFYDSRGNLLDFPRLLNYSVTSTWSHRGTIGSVATFSVDTTRTRSAGGVAYSLILAHHYFKNLTSAEKPIHQLRWSTNIQLTTQWSLTYTQSYDFSAKQVAAQQLNLHRDLHCWEGDLSWIPSGPGQGYYFLIRVKALPEIKLEKARTGIGDILSNFVQ